MPYGQDAPEGHFWQQDHRSSEGLTRMPVQNADIAAIFERTAELLEIKGDHQGEVRAYRHAARALEALPMSVAALLADGADLSRLPGVDADLAGKIASIVKTTRFDLLDNLQRQLPGDFNAIAAVPGLGPKRVRLLQEHLRVRTLDDLRRAAQSGQLRDIRGLGLAVEKKVLAALAKPQHERRFKLSVAREEAEALLAALDLKTPECRITIAGSYRRRRETVGDLDLVVTGPKSSVVGDRLIRYERVAEILAHGPTRTTVVLRSGLAVELLTVDHESFGAGLLYLTGSKAHTVALRTLAGVRGWKLNEYGLFAGKRRIAGATEEELYAKLGLDFIPPELREDRGEVASARENRLPALITMADIRGDLHVHSDWSDGTAPIRELAAAAHARGYQYLAITDPIRGPGAPNGLDAARLAQQAEEIDRLNRSLAGITILKGVETGILEDGSLDLPDAVLSRLDVVVAAVHSHFDLPAMAQTSRLVHAIQNPQVSILAHPTSRLIGQREPCRADLDRVIAVARAVGCHLEINADPDRLDLDDEHARAAKVAGVKLAISSGARSGAALASLEFGVDQARRGWVSPHDVINTRSLGELKKLLRR